MERGIFIERAAYRFIEEQVEKLIRKHFFQEVESAEKVEIFHDWSTSEYSDSEHLFSTLKFQFIEQFRSLYSRYNNNKLQLETLKKKIREAETKAESSHLKSNKEKIKLANEKLQKYRRGIDAKILRQGEIAGALKTMKQKRFDLLTKVGLAQRMKPKDEKVKSLIHSLKEVIKKIKDGKKKSLEKSMLSNLKALMHKKSFVKKVGVDISPDGEYIDINLFEKKDQMINKMSLSMGERQLYASALLMALVDESEIQFPVFIDSPMQKLDKDHARNIVNHFYPQVSHQVVLFPLIGELDLDNFLELKDDIERCHLIKQKSTNQSGVEELSVLELKKNLPKKVR